jgi:beta-lactamase class A
MIRNSSNSAATTMLERVGFDYVAQTLQSDRYALYDHDMNGGLWVGKPYAKVGAYKRDPLYNLSHAATPFEVARFYYLLETGRLVDPQASRTMPEMLSEPAIRHKFVLGLETHRPGSKIFRKSGTWRTYHADSAIVERDGRRYIAVAMANHPSGGAWLSKLIVAMDDLIFSPENVAHDHMEDHSEPVELPAKAVTASRS